MKMMKNIRIIAQIDPETHLLGRTGFRESNNGRDTTDNIKLIHQAVSLFVVGPAISCIEVTTAINMCTKGGRGE